MWIRAWFGPEREGRRLAKDARWIIDEMETVYSAAKMREVVKFTEEKLTDCHAAVAANPSKRTDVVRDVQRLHREARRQNDRVVLTAMTFVVIYLKAEVIGHLGLPARTAIDEFQARWRHAKDDC